MRRREILAILAASSLRAEDRRFAVTGIVLKVDVPGRSFVASIAAIPGYMEAMSMPFSLHDPKKLAKLKPGAYVDFTLVVEKQDSWVEDIKPHQFVSMEQEPLLARRLQLLQETGVRVKPLEPGQSVPDFTLIDQSGR